MNEISELIRAYDRLQKNIDVMQQDIIDILEKDFEWYDGGDFEKNVKYSVLFKEKILVYIIINLSSDIPFLQICKLDINTKKPLDTSFLKKNDYNKYFNPINDINNEKKLNDFIYF